VCRAVVCSRFPRSPVFPRPAVAHSLPFPRPVLLPHLRLSLFKLLSICPHFPLGRIHKLALIIYTLQTFWASSRKWQNSDSRKHKKILMTTTALVILRPFHSSSAPCSNNSCAISVHPCDLATWNGVRSSLPGCGRLLHAQAVPAQLEISCFPPPCTGGFW
jgi:hypothetical protein